MKNSILLLAFMVSGIISAQTLTWVDQFGGTLRDHCNAVVSDHDGNVYMTGSFEGNIDADPGPGVYNLTSAGGYDIFISKLSAAGALIWVKQIGSAHTFGGDHSYGIARGASGNIYVVGYFRDAADFDPDGEGYVMTPLPPYPGCDVTGDVFILKLSTDGDFIWAKQIGGNGSDKAAALALSPEEDVYITGEYVSQGSLPVDMDPNAGTYYPTPARRSAAFLLKLDLDGQFLWVHQWYTDGFSTIGCGYGDAFFNPYSIDVDDVGNVYNVGKFNFMADFDPSPEGVFQLNAGGTYDAYVFKMTSAGNFIWAKSVSGSSSHGDDVIAGPNGNVCITGSFYNTVDFDPGSQIKNLKAPGASNTYDAFVWVLSPAGDYVWAGQLGGSSHDHGRGIDVDGSGNMYITGIFSSTADMNPGSAKNTLKSAGGVDVFVTKLAPSGGYTWAVRLGGSLDDSGIDIHIDGSGNVLTAGSFEGSADFDPTTGSFILTSVDQTDMFVHKMSQSGGAIAPPGPPGGRDVVRAMVFPNPVLHELHVALPIEVEQAHISLFSMEGVLLRHIQSTTGDTFRFDVSSYPAGTYVVSINDGKETSTIPFVKN